MEAPIVDLRTDFVSRPTQSMIDAMVKAAAMPPSFGLRDDPIVRRLESTAAEILGKEDALFCPTCAMANQIAIHIHCAPGENFVCDEASHVLVSEAGAGSALSGATPRPVRARPGAFSADEVAQAIHPGDPGRSRTALIALENTHVHSGGRVIDARAMESVMAIARRASLPIHLDGSRVFNAAAALGTTAKALAAFVDSVAVSMNKGLGAPLGAILAGGKAFIGQALRVRQMFGGGWRPCGIPAAAALIGVETMIDRLKDDHARARRLAVGLANSPLVRIDLDQVRTNIVFATARDGARHLTDRLRSHGILVLPISEAVVRLVTYHNIGDTEIDRTIAAFDKIGAEECPR